MWSSISCAAKPAADPARARWRPGRRLSLVGECIEKTPSETKPDRGVMRFRHELVNQHSETVMTLELSLLVARRPGAG